jgi:hypothetical protein
MRNRFLGHSVPDSFADTSNATQMTLTPSDTAFYYNTSEEVRVYPLRDASANRAELNFLESLGLLYETNGRYYRLAQADLLYGPEGLFNTTEQTGIQNAIRLFHDYVLPGRARRARQLREALPNAIYTGRKLQEEELEAAAAQGELSRLLQIPRPQ